VACHAGSGDELRRDIIEWLVLLYIGVPGGFGTWGRNRAVFYSDSGAPLVAALVREDPTIFPGGPG
jgi:hypothetical protein